MVKRKKANKEYVLEELSFTELKERKQGMQNLIQYHWAYYSELAGQREVIRDELQSVLQEKSIDNFEFSEWQRAVKWKYSLHPLSSVGSITYIGQRFNYGNDINGNIAPFHGLYLAIDKDTALQETLGQSSDKVGSLTSRELALSSSQSETLISVSGKLDKVFDLRNARALTKFVNLIKNFKISSSLKKQAKLLGLDAPNIVVKPKQLLDSLLEKDWRRHANLYDIPSNSQIFGHIIYEAKIGGIIYKSKLTGKDCLVIFPDNFQNTESFIQLDDDAPSESVPICIDESNYMLSKMTHEQVLSIS